MNIVVKGESEIEIEADLMIINLEFKNTDKTYGRVLESGTNNVNEALEKIMPRLNISEKLLLLI